MKFHVTMKDPDTMHDAVHEAVIADLKQTMPDLEEDERDQLADTRKEKVLTIASKWFANGEYLTVEIDTIAKTCTVVPKSRTVVPKSR